jgi:capsular exopolysaccharide synthesis family protein
MGKMYDTLVRYRREQQADTKQTEKSLYAELFQKSTQAEIREARVKEHVDSNSPGVNNLTQDSPPLAFFSQEQDHKPAEESSIDQSIVVFYEPLSSYAEQFRILRSRLRKFAQENQQKSLLVLSTCAQEGKSFTAANLAISISQVSKSPVFLIDADLRRPSLQKMFGLKTNKGLADYLSENATLDEVIYKIGIDGFYFIPVGDIPHNPAELIATDRLKLLFDEIKNKCIDHWLIIDSSPLISTSEPSIISEYVNGSILIIQAEETDKKLVKNALSTIDAGKLLGVVLNRVLYQPKNYYYYPTQKK